MKSIIMLVVVCSFTSSFAQQQSYGAYVKSFKEVKRGGILNFEKTSQIINPMSREEALNFVYNGDTSKLVCVSQNFNMITEKKGSLLRSTRFPNKCMLLNMGDYFLLTYLSYECHDPNKNQIAMLNLTTVNKKYQLIDNLEVYRSSGDFTEVMGILNSSNGKIFLDGLLKNPSTINAAIYSVDSSTLKFKVLKESSNVKGDYTNFSKTLKNLGWEDFFMSNN